MANKNHIETQEEFARFKEMFKQNKCYLCKQSFSNFSEKNPCIHWFLNPKGFKKKHFPLIYNKYGFHQIESYLRWIANTEKAFVNINDLREENETRNIVIEQTFKYKDLEWSFLSKQSDFEGHANTTKGDFPHYHFQMKVSGLVIINYNGFHPLFNDYDDLMFAVKSGKIDKIGFRYHFGAGMNDVMELAETNPEEFIENLKSKDNDIENSTVEVSTLIIAKPGKTISGQSIYQMIEEMKRSGKSYASQAKELKDVDIITSIQPSPTVHDKAQRDKNR